MAESKEIAKIEEATQMELKELREANAQLLSRLAPEYAEMKMQIAMARELIKSKAFPNITPEQAFVLLQAGKEMGLMPMQSIKSLYIVNGAVGFYGAGLVARLTGSGCQIEYQNETAHGVTVVIHYDGKTYKEVVTDQDQILLKSKAMTFAKKNKMRYHGVRMIASFYLAHLTGSVNVWEPDDLRATEDLKKGEEWFDLTELINTAETEAKLDEILKTHKPAIGKSMDLTMLLGKRRKAIRETQKEAVA